MAMGIKSSFTGTLCLLAFTLCAWGQHQVAITIDDLPRGGDSSGTPIANREMTVKLMAPFKNESVPVTGFVNECHHTSELRQLLPIWIAAGAELGNHTCSHLDLSSTAPADFETDIVKGEAVTTEVMGRPPRFFRYPYLHTGKTDQTRDKVAAFLKQRGYINAPVTLDNDDYIFARVYADSLAKGDSAQAARILGAYVNYMDGIFAFFEQWSVSVTGHEVKQILLIHASQLNADAMPQLLAMMKRRGYELIALGEALTDEAYTLPDEYVGPMGISIIHRWAMTKGMTVKWEPESPEWIRSAYRKLESQ